MGQEGIEPPFFGFFKISGAERSTISLQSLGKIWEKEFKNISLNI